MLCKNPKKTPHKYIVSYLKRSQLFPKTAAHCSVYQTNRRCVSLIVFGQQQWSSIEEDEISGCDTHTTCHRCIHLVV